MARGERPLGAWPLAHDRLEVDDAEPAVPGRFADVSLGCSAGIPRSANAQCPEETTSQGGTDC